MKAKKFYMLVIVCVVVLIVGTTIAVFVSPVRMKSKIETILSGELVGGEWFPETPYISTSNRSYRYRPKPPFIHLPFRRVLKCINVDRAGVKHYIAYVFFYGFENVDPSKIDDNVAESMADMYFEQFAQYLNSYSYEQFSKEPVLLEVTDSMKQYIADKEEETEVKFWFSLAGMSFNLVEGSNDIYYKSMIEDLEPWAISNVPSIEEQYMNSLDKPIFPFD